MNRTINDDEFVKAVREHSPSTKAIAEHLGISQRAVNRRIKRWIESGKLNSDWNLPNFKPGAGRKITKVTKQLNRHGELQFFSVREQPQAPDDHFKEALAKPSRRSTLRGADGKIIQQWEITKPDDENILQQVHAAVEGFKEQIPLYMPVQEPKHQFFEDLINLYVLSDAHIGGLAWHEETGADWDVKIAEEMLTKAFSQMIKQSATAASCIIALLGDWMHYDKLEAVTTLSNNILDSDGRRGKMIKVAIRVARRVIAEALRHHDYVQVLVAEGNHDIVGSAWLRELFIVAFEAEPRVEIIDDQRPYYAIEHDNVLLGFHHGHLKGLGKKNQPKSGEELVAIFADEYREAWGRCKKVYIHTGHLHFAVEGEPRGARVMQHPTLATRDGWASRAGYGPHREARALTYHRRFGQTGLVNVSAEMVA